MCTAALCFVYTNVFNVACFFFLQVTNPPIDPIREKIVMSLVRQCYLVTQTSMHVIHFSPVLLYAVECSLTELTTKSTCIPEVVSSVFDMCMHLDSLYSWAKTFWQPSQR